MYTSHQNSFMFNNCVLFFVIINNSTGKNQLTKQMLSYKKMGIKKTSLFITKSKDNNLFLN